MSDSYQKINILGVEKELISVGGDKEKHRCWVIPFKLSDSPEQIWQQNFSGVQSKDKSEMKRSAHVDGNLIKVNVLDGDDLQKVLDVIKDEVEKTNALCEKTYQQKMKIRQDLENLKQHEQDITQKFKEESGKLSFE